ncbi:phosphoglycerate kinase [Angomonas deanei]|nr:phosphoglycerate kinase [Angomonas deanei]|eukprot:EPY37686.1 phosphoglycerate kinase [Angomonas deanei]
MAEVLASYGDIFINDAFGSCNREVASITDLSRIMGHCAAGYLMEREIYYFSKLLNNPPRPLVAIVGGGKQSDKIGLLANMLDRIDKLIIGGGVASAFLKAKGFSTGRSSCAEDVVLQAEQVLKTAKKRKVDVYLPLDHVCHSAVEFTERPLITTGPDVPEGYYGLDIGPKTVQLFSRVISECKAAVWNGPVGAFEYKCFSKGTFAIAEAMSTATQKNGLLSIIGGGDSANAVEMSGEAPLMSHVSTGGIASLELLEGKILPGIAALDDKE